ncbi:MAG: tail fiber domain-containing protein [Lewinellaceae bacterium]|nr:tail fiber domain-containing protein [Lewinellaceae bacterium]
MKHFLSVLLFLTALSLSAQNAPQGFNYQSIVRDANGNALANQTVVLLFSIRSGAPNGPVAYSEKQVVSSNDFGLVNLVVGQGGTPLQGSFAAINWGGGAKYLTVALETSPNVFDELGSSQLMSVPYALYAQSAANAGGGGDNWGSQTVSTAPSLGGNGTAANPLTIAQQNAQTGQVLKWDGTKWTPQNDGSNSGTVTEINTGAGLTGGPINSAGTISLSNTGVAPGIYGSATEIPVVTVDAQGRVTDIFKTVVQPGTVGINGGTGIDVQQNGLNFVVTNTGDTNAGDDVTNTSQADGDVSGTFSNLQIKAGVVGTPELANGAVTAAKLDDMNASNGQVLKWNGTTWAPQADAGITSVGLTAGAGISVTGSSPNFTVVNTGDTNAADDLTTSSIANGDISGAFANLQIKPDVVGTLELASNAVETDNLVNKAVTGAKISDMGASNGQVLKWNGTVWEPQTDNTGAIMLNAGPGIDVTGNGVLFTIFNTGDLNPFDDITGTSQANGDVTGTFTTLQLKPGVVTNVEMAANAVGTTNIINGSITGNKLNNMSAGFGQVLKWNGNTWGPANDDTGSGGDNWGAQVASTDGTLAGNGTPASPLKIAAQGAVNGQILKWNGSTWFPAADAGDNWGAQTANTTNSLTGNGTVANPLSIAQQGAGVGQILKWNGSSWVPGDDDGDNWGTQAVWTGPALTGNGTLGSPVNLNQQGATPGQVLKWNGTAWTPGNDTAGDDWGAQVVSVNATLGGNGTAGNPLRLAQQGAVNGQVLQWNGATWTPATFTGDDWGAQAVWTGPSLTGNGTLGSPVDLDQQGATPGQVLKWNGTGWTPGNDAVGGTGDIYSAGTGINIGGVSPNFVVNNTGDLDNTNELQTLGLVGNQLSLSSGGGTVTIPDYSAGTGISVGGAAPNFVINNTGDLDNTNELQTLGLVGNQLSLSNGGGNVILPAGNDYDAGTGISIGGAAPNFVINNTGDLSNTNEIQTLSILGNQLSLSNGGGTVGLPPGNTYSAGAGISITGSAPNFTVINTGDTDNDPTNEFQSLNLIGSVLEISGSGSTVDFTSLLNGIGDPYWKPDGDNILNANVGNVLIGSNASIGGKLQVSNTNGEPAAFITASSGAALVTGDGNVGIHTATPAFRLDVDGDGRFKSSDDTPQLTVENTGAGRATMLLKNSGDGGWRVSGDGGGAALFSVDFSGGPSTLTAPAITANVKSNVGIGGVNNGNSRLKVFQKDIGLTLQNTDNGHFWDFWVSAGNGDLVLYNDQFGPGIPAGTFSATTGLYLPSDRRLKKDIAAIPMGIMSRIMQLEPVSYHYKIEQENAKYSLGFLAQNVENLFPELVAQTPVRNGEGGYLSVNYSGFGVLAIKAIQEQQQQIESLRNENTTLRQQMESLETRLSRLEKMKE